MITFKPLLDIIRNCLVKISGPQAVKGGATKF